MSKSLGVRILSFVVAVFTLIGGFGIASFAAAPNNGDGSDTGVINNLTDILSTDRYQQYILRYLLQDGKINPQYRAKTSVKLDLTALNEDLTTAAGVKFLEKFDGDRKAIQLPEEGMVTWNINIPESGLYAIKIRYYPLENEQSKDTYIERSLYIDKSIPFYEASSLVFTKSYKNKYEYDENGNPKFKQDINGNEMRPAVERFPEWSEVLISDATGYYVNPFEFYFDEGEHTIGLYAQREGMIISEIELVPFGGYSSYEEYVKRYKDLGYKEVILDKNIVIQAEYPLATSEATVYPTTDRTSPISYPQSAKIIRLNTLGGGEANEKNWKTVGQWVKYSVTVPETGFYKIAVRFNQNTLEGAFVSRTIKIQTPSMRAKGELPKIPFNEANYLQFNYSDVWQVEYLNSGSEVEYMFFLEEGENILQFEAGLGNMAELIRDVEQALNEINAAYIKILKLAGKNPDQYRDYGFYERIPDAVDTLYRQAKNLKRIAENFEKITGKKGSHVASLQTISLLLERMGGKDAERQIAKNLTNLKENLGTLGTWLMTTKNQPLEIDYIMITSGNSTKKALPRANANFWESLKYEIKMFMASFAGEYNSYGQLEKFTGKRVEVWVASSRDDAQIIRNLISNQFTPQTGLQAELKLVAGSSLLPSILAGKGPDISIGHGSGDVINWAIRSAVAEITDMPGLDEVKDWFAPSAMIPLTLHEVRWEKDVPESQRSKYQPFKDTNGNVVEGYLEKYSVYGLPVTQNFPMLFYRADIFNDLGVKPPKTWSEFEDLIALLKNNNMDIAFPSGLAGTNLFLYQMGSQLYADGGMRVNLDSNDALAAFDEVCNYFQQHRFPLVYDFGNRFRSGEIPLGIVDYTTYTHLSVFATEIKGLWEFVPIPGYETVDENGNVKINNTAIAGVSAIIMLRGAEQKGQDHKLKAWEFMKWFVSADTQSRYAKELTAIQGVVAKHPTANKQALAELPWTVSEYKNLMAQFENTTGIPEYPGSYIIGRYVNFAFLAVYNSGAVPEESLLDRIVDINKELTRKRQEFGLAYKEISSRGD